LVFSGPQQGQQAQHPMAAAVMPRMMQSQPPPAMYATKMPKALRMVFMSSFCLVVQPFLQFAHVSSTAPSVAAPTPNAGKKIERSPNTMANPPAIFGQLALSKSFPQQQGTDATMMKIIPRTAPPMEKPQNFAL
jgi:hypothetical protein